MVFMKQEHIIVIARIEQQASLEHIKLREASFLSLDSNYKGPG